MANDIIKGEGETYEKDFYGNLSDSAKLALPLITAINEALQATAKKNDKIINIEANDIKQLNALNDSIEDTNKAFEQKLAVDKERATLQEKINKVLKAEASTLEELQANSDKLKKQRLELNKAEKAGNIESKEASKRRSELNILVKLANKQLTDAQKEVIALTSVNKKLDGEYATQSKRLNVLRKEFKDLILTEGQATDATDKLRDEITELDTTLKDVDAITGQFQRKVGEYPESMNAAAEATDNATKSFKDQKIRVDTLTKEYKDLVLTQGKTTKETDALLREIKQLSKELKVVDKSVSDYTDSLEDAEDATEDATDSFEESADTLLKVAGGALAAKLSLDGIQSSLESTSEGSENVREATSALNGIMEQTGNVVASTALDLLDLAKGLVDGSVNALDLVKSVAIASTGLGKLDNSSTAIRKNFNRTAEATENFTDKVKESIDGNVDLTRTLIAFEKAIRPLEIRLSRLNGLIDEQGIIAGDSTRTFNELSTAVLKGQELQIKRADIILSISRQELAVANERIRIANLAGGPSVELLDQQTAAIVKLIDAENDLKNEILENDKELRQIKQDRLERDLDILIDGFDNQKTINERIIANDKETLERRRALFGETTRLANESFESQKKVLQDLSNVGIDVDELLALDATELQKRIRQLEQSEIVEGRTLEVIRDRRTALLDLEEANQTLIDSEQEGIDLRKDIAAQEEALGKITVESLEQTNAALKELDDQRLDNEISNLERRIELSEDGSLEQLTIQKELNDLLLERQKKSFEEQEELTKDNSKELQEIQQALLSKLEERFISSSNKRLENLDEELKATQDQQDRLQKLAEKGVLGADESILAEEKRAAEIERQKQAEERRQELITAGFKIFSALIEEGKSPGEAVLETSVILGALPAIIESLPTFFEGTKNIGESLGKPQLPGRDGFIIRADGTERIVDGANNAKMGGVSNDQAADIVHDYNSGLLGYMIDFNQPKAIEVNTNWSSNEQVLNKFDSMQRAIISTNLRIEKAIENQPVLDDVKVNELLQQLTVSMKSKNKVTRTTFKHRSIF